MPERPLGLTYIRAPNLSYPPDGPLQLGNVIENPYRPTKLLHTLTPVPPTITVKSVSNEINRSSKHSLHGKAWAQLFQGYQVNIGAESSGEKEAHYSMDSLDTTYFKADPTDEEAQDLAKKHTKISEVLNKRPRRPVYLITGLKIAKNLTFSSGGKKKKAANAGGGAQVTDQVAVGGEVGGSKEEENDDSYRVEGDIIIAYQLHIIGRKGLLGKKVEVDVYEPDEGFQGVDEGKEEKEEEFATRAASVADLMESADMYEIDCEEPEEETVGDQRFVVISAEEE